MDGCVYAVRIDNKRHGMSINVWRKRNVTF